MDRIKCVRCGWNLRHSEATKLRERAVALGMSPEEAKASPLCARCLVAWKREQEATTRKLL